VYAVSNCCDDVQVIALWQSTDFRFVAHQARDTHIISAADDIMALLEESQVTIGTIRGSRYVTPIKTQVRLASL